MLDQLFSAPPRLWPTRAECDRLYATNIVTKCTSHTLESAKKHSHSQANQLKVCVRRLLFLFSERQSVCSAEKYAFDLCHQLFASPLPAEAFDGFQ